MVTSQVYADNIVQIWFLVLIGWAESVPQSEGIVLHWNRVDMYGDVEIKIK